MLPLREREDVDRHRHLWKDTDALERHLLQVISDRTAKSSSAAYQLDVEPADEDDEAYDLEFEYDEETGDPQLYRIETKTGRKKLMKTFQRKGRRDMSKVNCYRCGALGHFGRDCEATKHINGGPANIRPNLQPSSGKG